MSCALAVAVCLPQEAQYDDAAVLYLWLAEMGVEIAQHNSAKILEQGAISTHIMCVLCVVCVCVTHPSHPRVCVTLLFQG